MRRGGADYGIFIGCASRREYLDAQREQNF
jgi:hypothetical protein